MLRIIDEIEDYGQKQKGIDYTGCTMRGLLKKILSHRPSKFLALGGVTVLTEYLTFTLLVLLTVPLFAANTLSFFCGLLLSYHLNRRWVFGSNGGIKRFGIYVTLAVINLAISNIIVLALHDFGTSEFVAKVIAMALIVANNYFLYSRFIFKS